MFSIYSSSSGLRQLGEGLGGFYTCSAYERSSRALPNTFSEIKKTFLVL